LNLKFEFGIRNLNKVLVLEISYAFTNSLGSKELNLWLQIKIINEYYKYKHQ
jgi:hypothetical protein